MYVVISKLGQDFLALLLMGIMIKFMDDFLDRELDALENKVSLANSLGSGVLPYAVVIFILAMAFNRDLALATFLASYGVGMFSESRRRMPTGLKGWQESLIALLISASLTGWRMSIWAFAAILAVQVIDDLIDFELDRLSGAKTIVIQLGKVESGCIGVAGILASLFLDLHLSLMLLVTAPLIGWLAAKTQKEVEE